MRVLSLISVADVYMLMGVVSCRNCAFVNFTNISNAIKAIDGIKNKSDYANLHITHGKDWCANPPQSGPQGGGCRTASGNTAATATASSVGDEGAEGVLGAGDPSACDQVKEEEEEGLVLGDGAKHDGVKGTN